MDPELSFQLAKSRIAEDQAWAARQRLAREAQRSAAFAGHGDASLLERLIDALRHAGRPAARPAGGAI